MILIKKPWGREELLEKNKKFMVKRLFMKKGHRCSLQYHNKKKETIFVLSGKLKVFFGKKKNDLKFIILKRNQSITLSPKTIHRMQGLSSCYYLEMSTPELKDVVRLSDDYSRA